MGSYLHIQVGRYHLLLDTRAIHEVMEHTAAQNEEAAAGYRLWRDRALPVVVCSELLGEEGTSEDKAGITVVYSPDENAEPVLLDADRVYGLWHVADDEWVKPPPLPETVERLFDGLCTDGRTGGQLYRVRRGFLRGLAGLPG